MPTAQAIDRRAFLTHSAALTFAGLPISTLFGAQEPLAGTTAIDWQGDLAARMVDGLHAFLDRETAASVEKRKQFWKPDYSSVDAYLKSVAPNRERLKKILGVVDARVPNPKMEYVATTDQPALVAEADKYKVYAVRWPVFEDVDGEGLLLEPKEKVEACVIALPDADWTPEMFVGLAPGVDYRAQVPRHLAAAQCRVLVPMLLDRQDAFSGNPKVGRMTNETHREFVYRMGYELGRHIIGYEVEKVFAAVDWFHATKDHPPIAIFGYGEGGLIALHCAAIDERIQMAIVSGHFGPREKLAEEPVYRNVSSLLTEFGDGELIRLIIPRSLTIEWTPFKMPPRPAPHDGRGGAAPGYIEACNYLQCVNEISRIMKHFPDPKAFHREYIDLMPYGFEGTGVSIFRGPGTTKTLESICKQLKLSKRAEHDEEALVDRRKSFQPIGRLHRQFDQLVEHTQRLLRESETKRQEFFWSKLSLKSQDDYRNSCEPLRKYFWEEVIGKLPAPEMPANPRTRQLHDTPKWKSYEVTLDLYPDVFAYGILCVPKDLKDGEKRPVVVCQHGLEGRPTNVVNPTQKTQYYNSFGSALADRGFVVFAPQNPYIFQNKFRQLQRKANPLKLSLFSFIVRQHERILDWLATQPFVDDKRMGFYGLSYGGKTAMRVPAILERYCLSICSGDFNEWIWKNVTVDWRGSYMFSGEYEMYEFDLGNTFNYAEMAALIAPRPFMVERGHDDGVGLDEWVAYEYAKVRRLYAKLGIPDRTTIEFFNGGHECHNVGTFAFLHKHLNWPEPKT